MGVFGYIEAHGRLEDAFNSPLQYANSHAIHFDQHVWRSKFKMAIKNYAIGTGIGVALYIAATIIQAVGP